MKRATDYTAGALRYALVPGGPMRLCLALSICLLGCLPPVRVGLPRADARELGEFLWRELVRETEQSSCAAAVQDLAQRLGGRGWEAAVVPGSGGPWALPGKRLALGRERARSLSGRSLAEEVAQAQAHVLLRHGARRLEQRVMLAFDSTSPRPGDEGTFAEVAGAFGVGHLAGRQHPWSAGDAREAERWARRRLQRAATALAGLRIEGPLLPCR